LAFALLHAPDRDVVVRFTLGWLDAWRVLATGRLPLAVSAAAPATGSGANLTTRSVRRPAGQPAD